MSLRNTWSKRYQARVAHSRSQDGDWRLKLTYKPWLKRYERHEGHRQERPAFDCMYDPDTGGCYGYLDA